MLKDVIEIDKIIGMTVLSRATGNKLGKVQDLYIDPVQGIMMGVTIEAPNGKLGGVDYGNIYSFGKDAVMVGSEEGIVPLKEEWVEQHPHAKKHLIGTNIVTESGNQLGQIGNIFVCLTSPPYVVYEVRDSVLDKLLGRNFFIFASSAATLSNNAERIIVPDETLQNAASSLPELINRANAGITNREAAQQNPGLSEEQKMARGGS